MSTSRGSLGALASALLPCLLAWACSSEESPPPSGSACAPDEASIQATIFAPSCALAGCHSAEAPAVGLDLAAPDVVARLEGAPSATCDGWALIVPGSPERSFLFEKIAAAQPACGAPMPMGQPLGAEQQECVRQWIAGLAGSGGSGGGGGAGGGGCETCGQTACVDLGTDPAHCGACDAACPAGAGCAAEECVCAGGLMECGAQCVDTALDAAHCGGCEGPCPTGALCGAGQCACAGTLEVCSDACVDTSSDPSNCGGCGVICSGGSVCNLGDCLASCGSLTKCGASCVDTDTSATHCGGCDNPCPAGATCVGGACQCPAGTSACGGACINTLTDPTNCGDCGVICSQGTTCEASACVCPGGGTVCGASCVDTQTDVASCGACGNACAAGQTCVAGVCTCGDASVSFAADVQPIFTASCAGNGCHRGVMPQAGLNLSTGNAYLELVNVAASQCNDGRMRVLPGQPSSSYLIDKMMNVDICSGTKMPKLGVLGAGSIATVSNWICAGAQNN